MVARYFQLLTGHTKDESIIMLGALQYDTAGYCDLTVE